MKKLLKNMKENEKGFTLIELIVVIAIIGILAAVLLPKFSGFTDDARKKSVMSEAKSVYTAYSVCQANKSSVTSADMVTYLGKLPQGVKAATSITIGTDPIIQYTSVMNGNSYTVKIKDGGDIEVMKQ